MDRNGPKRTNDQSGLVCVTLHITRFMNNRVMWKTLLGTWIALGLHLDQSKYLGRVVKSLENITRLTYNRVPRWVPLIYSKYNSNYKKSSYVDNWIPLGLHLDQYKYLGCAHNSINILSSNSTRNPISLISSYVQTITHNMDSFEIHCAQHGLL